MTVATSDDRWFERPFSDEASDVAEFVLNAPAAGNRLTTGMMTHLADALEARGSSEDCRLIVVSAEGDDFCLGRQAAGANLGFTPTTARELTDQINGSLIKLFNAIRTAPVPVISIVRGRAVGFGCALAAACDLTLAGPTCSFELDEMGHGKPPLMALSVLSRYVPPKSLATMVYTTDPVPGADAVSSGLASEVANSDEELADRATELVTQLRTMPAESLRTVKEYLAAVGGLDTQQRTNLGLSKFANAVVGGAS